MKNRVAAALVAAALSATVPLGAAHACSELSKLKLGTTEIYAATPISGRFAAPPNGMAAAQDGFSFGPKDVVVEVPFCRVQGMARPVRDSLIAFEVWLPEQWNGKLQAVGSGKMFGAINYDAMADALKRGYAVVSSDSGHVSSRADMSWAIGHPEKMTDFYFRADYESSLAARAVVKARYGRPPDHAYFVGCARGGTSGLAMAQRYPDLFDGVYAGSPGIDVSHQMANFIWTALAIRDPLAAISRPKAEAISRAVVAACDADDGLVDGEVTNPAQCAFSPASIACKLGEHDDCLTDAQVAALEKIYAGPTDPRTGLSLYPGHAGKGSEFALFRLYEGGRPGLAQMVGAFVYQDLDWDWTKFDFAGDMDRVTGALKQLDLTPDLNGFAARNGKIIITNGWLDPYFSPVHSIIYYDGVEKNYGRRPDFMKMFFAPAMAHCGVGPGPNNFDALTALEDWVEKGQSPTRLIATKFTDDDPSKAPIRSRPLCAFPERARYKGAGDINNADNFECH